MLGGGVEDRPRKPPSPFALPPIAAGVWREVGRLHCLRLECRVGILLWREGDEWHYRSSGAGVLDEEVRTSPERGLEEARRGAARWLAFRGGVIADQASAVVMDTGTR